MSKTFTMQTLRSREQSVFPSIPGMTELIQADHHDLDRLEARYPDAAFALRTAAELFHHDRELSLITQRAYFSILNGESIPSVRHRYNKEMDLYIQAHMWDD